MQQSDTLTVPYLPELDSMELSELANMLDERGHRCPIESLNWAKDFPYHPLTVFSIAHSGTAIYIDFFVRCNYLRAVNYENNSPVCQDSCVEFFISPAPYEYYYNFEWNCIGTINTSKRRSRHDHEYLTDDQLARVRRHASCGTRPFEELEGLFTWNLVVAIPLDLIGVKYEGKPIDLKGNLYKCSDLCTQPHYISFFPIDTPQPDFHRPEFFGKITLE